jgi:hypothetical protein
MNFIFCSAPRYFQSEVCGEGKTKEKTFHVGPFSRIFASAGTIQLDPTKSSSEVTVEGEENVLAELSVSTYGNTLYIMPKNPLTKLSPKVLIACVGIANYSSLLLGGNVHYYFNDVLKAQSFYLELFGEASCKVLCDVKELQLKVTEDTRLVCEGKADLQEVLIYDRAQCEIVKLLGRLHYHLIDGQAKLLARAQ